MREKTIPFWQMRGSAKLDQYMIGLSNTIPPSFEVLNLMKLFNNFRRENIFLGDGPEEIKRIGAPVVPKLKVAVQDYHPSIVPLNLASLYSSELRKVLDSTEEVIQYIDIDASGCSQPFKDKDYKFAHVLTIGDVIDLEASGFEAYMESGVEKWRPITLPSNENEPVKHQPFRFTFLENFQKPSPIFRARWAGQVMVCDDLARKILLSKIDDVVFQDITYNDIDSKTIRIKTLKGAEIVGYEKF